MVYMYHSFLIHSSAEVGGGIGMGNTCKPMADSFQCMTKSTTIKIIIIIIIKYKKFKKRKMSAEELMLLNCGVGEDS